MSFSSTRYNAACSAATAGACAIIAFSLTPSITLAEGSGAELGVQLQQAEDAVLNTPQPWRSGAEPAEIPEAPVDTEEQPAADTPPADADLTQITGVTISGDEVLLRKLDLIDRAKAELEGKKLSAEQILDVASLYQKICVKTGYYLTSIVVQPNEKDDGHVTLYVDKGRTGRISFYDPRQSADFSEKTPFSEEFFSERQLRSQLSVLKDGKTFNYREFYNAVFTVNARPDVTMDTDLRLRKDYSTGNLIRYADIDFFVREDSPLHAVLEIKNNGTESTGEWRASGTLQHLNLTKHDDILTLNIISSTEFGDLISGAGSYYLPHNLLNGGALTFYGGYSEVSTENIVPLIDLMGEGWFAGLQASFNIIDTENHLLTIAGSLARRRIEDSMELNADCTEEDAVEVEPPTVAIITPLSVVLSYSSAKPDRLGGRTFITSQTSFNLGGSDEEELTSQRRDADPDYFVERIQAARVQPVFGRRAEDGSKRAQWLLYAKVDAQFSSTALIPVEQKAIGGMDSIRGYTEREALGDTGYAVTLELRTPLLSGVLFRKSKKDHLQFLAFVDAGEVSLEEPIDGISDSVNLLGTGLGLRYAVSKYTQFKFDYGIPLEETEESDAGRAHLSLQVQY